MNNENMNRLFMALLAGFLIISITCVADSLSVFFNFSEKYNQTSVFGGGTTKLVGEFSNQVQYESGTATDAKEVDTIYVATGTIPSAATLTVDLRSLADFKGTAFSFSKIKTFCVRNSSTTASISFGGTWVATETITPLGLNVKTSPLAGLTVASGASVVNVSTPSNSEYELAIIGIKN